MPTTDRARRSAKARDPVQLLTIDQVASILAVSIDRVYRLMRSGELDWVQIGSSRRVRSDDLAGYMARQTNVEGPRGGYRPKTEEAS